MQQSVYTRVMVGLPIRRFRVEDASMQPALRPGDHLLVLTWTRSAKAGDIVVLRDPEAPSTYLVKRVITRESKNGALVVGGDSPNVSRDSRHFGPVPAHLVIGRAIYRYRPPERRGRL